MVTLSITNTMLMVEVQGFDRVWALKSRLEIPLAHIQSATIDANRRLTWKTLRLPGTYVPGVITAGTFYQAGKRMFWDVKNPENTIVIPLHDDRYAELIVEVADPAAAATLINTAIAG